MIGLALRGLRHHRNGFLASFVALFFGAAIVVACGGLLETGVHAAAPPHRLAAAPIVVTGDQFYPDEGDEFAERVRLDAGLVDRVASVPGVAAAVPDLAFPSAVLRDGAPVEPPTTGRNWSATRLAPLSLTEGAEPARAGQAALDPGLAEAAGVRVGGRVTLSVSGRTGQYLVTGLVAGPGAAGAVFLADAEAATLVSRPGQVDSIGVFTTPGSDPASVRQAVEAAVAGAPATVLTGDERGRAENTAVVTGSGTLITMAAVFGGLSAGVTVFVVASTLGLALQQRQREMALLRAIGTTPAQLHRLVLGETLVVAAAATALACWPGPLLGGWLLDVFAGAGVVPESIVFRAGWVPMAVGAGTALLTALGAAFIAARGAARTRPTEALAEAAVRRRWFSWVRLVAAVLCLGGAVTLSLVTANMAGPQAGSTAIPAAMLWTAGFGLLGPGLAKVSTAVLRWPLRAVTGFAGHLAMLNARARAQRVAGAVMPVMLASGLATAMIYLQTTQAAGADRAFTESLKADLVLTSTTGGLPLSLVDTVAGLPGVAAASAQLASAGFVEPPPPPEQPASTDEEDEDDDKKDTGDPTEVPVQGVSAEGVARATAFHATSGSLADLRGDTVALPTSVAADTGHALGDRVPMRLGDGSQVSLELVATLDGQRGYETALVPAALLVAHTDSGLLPQIVVSAEPGADRTRLTGALSGLAAQQPGLRVADREALTAAQTEHGDTQSWMSFLVVGMVLGYATIALVNTQVLATTERRREFTLQRLIGSTRTQVVAMMAVEAVLVAAAGILLGLLVAALTLVPLSQSVLGSAVPDGPLWILLAVVGGTLVLTLGTTLLSTTLVLRTRPGDAIGVRE